MSDIWASKSLVSTVHEHCSYTLNSSPLCKVQYLPVNIGNICQAVLIFLPVCEYSYPFCAVFFLSKQENVCQTLLFLTACVSAAVPSVLYSICLSIQENLCQALCCYCLSLSVHAYSSLAMRNNCSMFMPDDGNDCLWYMCKFCMIYCLAATFLTGCAARASSACRDMY